MKKIFLFHFFISLNIYAQIVFTGVDKLSESVKAYYFNLETEQLFELSYGNSYLPRCLNENYIVLNIGNSIFKVDKFREKHIYLFDGFLPVVSNSGKYIAAYSKNGITIADSSGKILRELEVDYWSKITPIFSFDEKSIFYYDEKRKATFKLNWEKQTNELFAHYVFHPIFSPDGTKLLINVGKVDSNFRVGIVRSDWNEKFPVNYITSPYENSIVPIWSPSGKFIAYMNLLSNKSLPNSDLIPARIVIYDVKTGIKQIVTEDAGFTEGAYPQFSFSPDENFFYYTAVREDGSGTIVQVDLQNDFEKKILINDPHLDARIPLYLDKVNNK
jgi:Tol biopolymer transport system component